MKCEKWTDQHDTNVGQRKNLSPLQKSNSWQTLNTGQALYTMHMNSVTVTLLPMSPHSSVDRAPARVSGHEFDSCREVRFFFCFTLVPCWSVHFSHFPCFFSPVCLFSQKEISFPKDVTDFCCVTKRTWFHARQEAHVLNYWSWRSRLMLKQTFHLRFFQAPSKLEEKQFYQFFFQQIEERFETIEKTTIKLIAELKFKILFWSFNVNI